MWHEIRIIAHEVGRVAREPKRALAILNSNRRRAYWGYLRSAMKVSDSWSHSNGGLSSRTYETYKEYIEHQKSRLEYLELDDYDAQFRPALKERLSMASELRPGMNALCLGARIGSEVKAFHDLGLFAIGVDINARKNNPYVVYGDFQSLVFPANSVDVVYTNSMDHAFDASRLLGEVWRILKPDGIFIDEISRGREESAPGPYESFWWKSVSDLVTLLEQSNFQVIRQSKFTIPWPGEHVFLRKREARG